MYNEIVLFILYIRLILYFTLLSICSYDNLIVVYVLQFEFTTTPLRWYLVVKKGKKNSKNENRTEAIKIKSHYIVGVGRSYRNNNIIIYSFLFRFIPFEIVRPSDCVDVCRIIIVFFRVTYDDNNNKYGRATVKQEFIKILFTKNPLPLREIIVRSLFIFVAHCVDHIYFF